MSDNQASQTVDIKVVELRSALILGVKDGYDQVVKEGRLSQMQAMVTVGYICSAISVFELIGDSHHVQLFTTTATKIRENWKDYMEAMQMLFRLVDIEGPL